MTTTGMATLAAKPADGAHAAKAKMIAARLRATSQPLAFIPATLVARSLVRAARKELKLRRGKVG
jgi:anti-sigma factor RsiW